MFGFNNVASVVFLLQLLSPSMEQIARPRQFQRFHTGRLTKPPKPFGLRSGLGVLQTSEFRPDVDLRKAKTESFYSAAITPFQSPVYEFRYKIHDPKEKNYQEKAETRVGDTVRGYYSVREPNGYVRIVNYSSDKNGFRTEISHRPADDITDATRYIT